MSRGKRSQPSPERTEEERERDRAERARRRAERAGEGRQDLLGGPRLPAAAVVEEPRADPPLPQPPDPPLPQPPVEAEVEAPAATPPEEPAPQAEPEPSEPQLAIVASGGATAGGATAGGATAGGSPPAPVPPPPAPEPAAPRPPAPQAPPVRRVTSAAPELAAPAARTVTAARRPGRRSSISRALALLALAAVVTAIVLLAKSLFGSGQEKKTSVTAAMKVVIPEGTTRLQIAQIASRDGLAGSYRGASKRSALLDPARYGAPAGTHHLEGFLFPATYELYPGAPVGRLVHEQLIAFRENFGASETARAHTLHETPYQLLTVASMVEREAKVPADRAKIAAVIYNRLRRGMPLGVDATIYYALEMQKGIATYTKELTEAQLQLNSPYNTRTRKGLPPTPIANPGLASIQAAAHPAHVTYLYYVLAADGCGEHVFSSTLADFEAHAAAYQAAVKKNGGAPPACKLK